MTTNRQDDHVEPARAGVDVEGDAAAPAELGQAERSTTTELGESMPLTDAARDRSTGVPAGARPDDRAGAGE